MATKKLGDALLRHFDGDADKVKKLGTECKLIGLPLGDNAQQFIDNPECLFTLVSYSEFGVLGKLVEINDRLNKKGRP